MSHPSLVIWSALSIAVLASVACGTSATSPSAGPASTTGAPTATTVVTPEPRVTSTTASGATLVTNVPYTTGPAPAGWSPLVMDRYEPVDSDPASLVVIVPRGGPGPLDPTYGELADRFASAGTPVAVIHWGFDLEQGLDVPPDGVPALVAEMETARDQVLCGLASAISTTELDGATPFVTVVGHHSGANAAAMALLRPHEGLEGCIIGAGDMGVNLVMLWDGDWLGAAAGDRFGDRTAEFLAAYSPWPALDEIGAGAYLEVGLQGEGESGSGLTGSLTRADLTVRDPDGWLAPDLDDTGSLDDGVLSPLEQAIDLSFALHAHGLGGGFVSSGPSDRPEAISAEAQATIAAEKEKLLAAWSLP